MSKKQPDNNLAEPFSQIFIDRAEANWAFDLLRETVKQLGLKNPYDPRFALTLPHHSGKLCLHLNFGRWLVLGFRGPSLTAPRVEMALLANQVSWNERFTPLPSERKEGEPEVRSYHLLMETVRPLTSDLQAAFETTLDFIAGKFHAWKRTPFWKQHNPEIVEALFDPEKRERLLAGLLAETELRYERHLTAFHQEIGEEEAIYQIDSDLADESEMTPIHDTISEPLPQRRSDMDLARGKMEEKLKAAFLQFQQDSSNHFLVTLRRKRAEQIRALLSNSDEIDLETFNREVWVNQSATYLQGKRINFNEPSDFEKIIDDIEQAIESSELELHGNYIWGSASRVYAPKLKDDTKKLEYLRQALYILNDANLTPMQKAQQISKIYGFGNNIITGLVMLFHPTEFGLYNNEGKRILKNLGYEITNSIEAYEETLRNLKEKLYAQDFLELDLFLFMFNREHGLGAETKSISKVKEEELDIIFQPYPLSQLAADTGLAETELARWVRAIERKGQAIFYGPPGTGKTFIAEKLAQHLIGGGDGFVDLVQFHPAYAYEDFIQGLRPKARPEGGLDYPLVPGRFLEFCQKANQRQSRCVLIIDEINRANLARVFGELMYLLEYRRRQIPLAGGEKFAIPANVRLIGTMNTADRSIALVDHALRRRFAFIVLSPNYEVLRLYHRQKQTGFPVENLIELLIRLNREIADPHYAIGITFFLHQNLSAQIEDIWRMEIEPYLEEYFFDQAQKVEDFRWPAIEQKIWP